MDKGFTRRTIVLKNVVIKTAHNTQTPFDSYKPQNTDDEITAAIGLMMLRYPGWEMQSSASPQQRTPPYQPTNANQPAPPTKSSSHTNGSQQTATNANNQHKKPNVVSTDSSALLMSCRDLLKDFLLGNHIQ